MNGGHKKKNSALFDALWELVEEANPNLKEKPKLKVVHKKKMNIFVKH
jgi:hypothetical protein